MNIWDVVVGTILVIAVVIAARSIWRSKGRGCNGNCEGCGLECSSRRTRETTKGK